MRKYKDNDFNNLDYLYEELGEAENIKYAERLLKLIEIEENKERIGEF